MNTAWTGPAPLIIAALCIGGYWWLRDRARRDGRDAAPWWRFAAFCAGVVTVSAALASPLATLAEQMFLWHMVQHILVVDIAPILLISGFDEELFRPLGTRLAGLRKAFTWLTRPVSAVLLYAGTLWFWHVPGLYNAALGHPALHVAQHASLLAVGLVFWAHVLQPVPSRHSMHGPGVFPFMAITKFATGVLASLLTFLPERGFVYDFYVNQPRMWGLTAAEDQQLGGAIMVTEELVLLSAAFGLMFVRMLGHADEEDARRERLEAERL